MSDLSNLNTYAAIMVGSLPLEARGEFFKHVQQGILGTDTTEVLLHMLRSYLQEHPACKRS